MSTNTESPLRSPEYLAPLKEIIPVFPDPNRLCSQDGACGHGEGGCRRTETLLAWESENPGKYVPGNLFWGSRDLYFVLDNVMYYYKPFLEKKLEEVVQSFEEDKNNTEYVTKMVGITQLISEANPALLPSQYPTSISDIRTIINSAPQGMPVFIKETEHFFCFEDIGTRNLTAADINRPMLSLIQSTFSSEYTLPYWTPCISLYLKEDKVYWTDLIKWCKTTSPDLKTGVVFVEDAFRFYTFSPLDSKGQQVMDVVGNYLAREYNVPFEIVNL